ERRPPTADQRVSERRSQRRGIRDAPPTSRLGSGGPDRVRARYGSACRTSEGLLRGEGKPRGASRNPSDEELQSLEDLGVDGGRCRRRRGRLLLVDEPGSSEVRRPGGDGRGSGSADRPGGPSGG